jgi:4-hydroxyproline epimerase
MIAESLKILDSHTGGEPTRLILDVPLDLPLGAVAVRKFLAEKADWIRSAAICEPRGSEAVVGAMLCEPTASEADLAVVYFNNAGYLGMCGHGTIGLVTSLAFLRRLTPGQLTIETPAGNVRARLNEDGSVEVENVKAFRLHSNIEVNLKEIGKVTGDVAYGGNWFFLCSVPGIAVDSSNLDQLAEVSKAIRRELALQGITGADGAVIDHVEIFGNSEVADSRNYVLCPGGAYDRSPCGTGTSAKLACLAADGKVGPGAVWRQESIVGSIFEAWYQSAGGGIIPTIRGRAFVTGEGLLKLDPNDPYREGIQL